MQSKTPFFIIIGAAIITVAGMVLAWFLYSDTLEPIDTGPSVTIQVVAAPAIKPWVDQAAKEFNQANKNQVEIISANELIPETQFTGNPQVQPPAAWLAEASFVVDMDNDMQFADTQSVAGDSLAWGTFLADDFSRRGGLNWDTLHQRAVEPNSTLKVVIASPQNSAAGIAALASAAAAHLGKQTLTSADVSSAEPWLTDTLKESARTSLNLGPKPAEAFATRGASIGDAGILGAASWQEAGLQNRPDFTTTPPQPNVNLDYPFAIWTGNHATPEAQAAAQAFRDFLLSEAQQQTLADFHLNRAGTNEPDSVQLDGPAALALFRWAERELR